MGLADGGNAGTVEVDVVGDYTKFERGLKESGGKAGGKFGQSFGTSMGSTIARVGGAYMGAQFGRGVIDQASDLAEATNVTGLAFGQARDEVDKLAKSSSTMFGLAESEFRQLGAQVGNIFVGAGVAERDAAKLTNSLIGRATDMGSAWNASSQEVTEAINSGLIGSFEPLRKYGVIIDKAAVKQKALEMGLADANGEVDQQAEKLATAALIMEQTENVAGDFANTSDGVANSQKIIGAQWKDMQAQLGAGLLPVISQLLGVVKALGPDGMRMVVMIGAGVLVFTKLAQAASAFGGALKLLAANPWVLAALAIVAVGVLIWRNWDTIVEKLGAAWAWLTATVSQVAGFFVEAWRGAVAFVTEAFDMLAGFFVEYWPYILGIFTGGIGLIVGLIIQNWDAIWAKTQEVTGAIVGFFSSAWDAVWGTTNDIGGKVVGFITDIPNKIAGAFVTLAETIAAPFRTAFGGIKSAWNSTVGGFGFNVPGWIPGVGGKAFNIPSMATGAVVSVPTLAMVGDAGAGNPEIVSPVRLMRDTVADALAAGGQTDAAGDSFTFHGPLIAVDGNSFADPNQLERHAVELLRVIERELGRVRRGAGLTTEGIAT